MAFALLKPKAIDVSDLPLFDFQKFFNKEEIGKGGFGAVFTADYYPCGSGNSPEKVFVKKALGEDLEDKKNFVKEAGILRDLQHPNIVNFKGICTTPAALIKFSILSNHRTKHSERFEEFGQKCSRHGLMTTTRHSSRYLCYSINIFRDR